jgi:hypothetical protein
MGLNDVINHGDPFKSPAWKRTAIPYPVLWGCLIYLHLFAALWGLTAEAHDEPTGPESSHFVTYAILVVGHMLEGCKR